MACYSGYTVKERINLHSRKAPPIELGFKTFHCVRRFMLAKINGRCELCKKDMNKECFFIHKDYYGPNLVLMLIRIYENCFKTRFNGDIWPDAPYYADIVRAISSPMPKNIEPAPRKDYMAELEDKKDRIEEVPF